MKKQSNLDEVKSEFQKFHDLAASGGSIVEKIERDDLPFPFTRPIGIERYCEFPHTTGGNPPKVLGMTVVITTSGADNQVFLNSSSNMFLSD